MKFSLVAVLFLLISAGVYMNLQEKEAIDNSKIPEKLEDDRGFQRWITNAKDKDIDVDADEFRLLEENEIYNTKWMQVYSLDNDQIREQFQQELEAKENIDHVIFSPSELIYLDYRNISRDGYKANEVHLYGKKEDKILDARILECFNDTNCYFDRAYFLDNDTFVVHEISLADPNDLCPTDETCSYTFKVHLVDLINNKRWIYGSEEKALELNWAKQEL